jgi:hypothetical protein
MAKRGSSDFFSSLRAQGLRKSLAKALADLESSGRGTRGNAEKLARRAIDDLRSAADGIEKALNIGGAGTRSSAAKKGASTRKRAATKRSSAAKKGAKTRARKATSSVARKATGTARKATKRKATKRKSTARKSPARKSS